MFECRSDSIFNLVQIIILLIALLSSVATHLEHRMGRKRRALAVDESVRKVAWMLYVGLMASVLAAGATRQFSIVATCVITIVAVGAIIVLKTIRLLTLSRRRRRALFDKLDGGEVDLHTHGGEALARQLFDE